MIWYEGERNPVRLNRYVEMHGRISHIITILKWTIIIVREVLGRQQIMHPS